MKRYVLVGIALLSVGRVHAAVIPQMINYTGTVQVNSNPFNGDGYFRFALINDHNDCQADPPGPNCDAYWSSDATSQDGEAPDNALKITVTNGLFSIKLGDTNRINHNSSISMPTVPGSVFDRPLVYLRIWFDDGVNGVQRLAPDRQLVAVPFAYRAEVAEKLSGVGSVTQANLAPGSVAAAQIIDGSIIGADVDTATTLNVAGLQVGQSLLVQTDQGGSLELGGANGVANPQTGGTPYLDFHYGTGSAEDFNVRIINQADSVLNFQTKSAGNVMTVNGGNVGIGTTAPGEKLDVAGAVAVDYLRVDPQNDVNEGGEIKLIGAGAYGTVQLDNYAGHVRVHTLEAGKQFQVLGGSIYADSTSAPNYFGSNVGIGIAGPTTKLQVAGEISPAVDNSYSLGDAALRFTAVYAVNGTIQTSDIRQKLDIQLSDLGLDFINQLRPVSYRWNNGVDSDLHYGLIAQETEKAINEAKIRAGTQASSPESAIVTHDPVSDRYGLKYAELIAPIIKAIQEIHNLLAQTRSAVIALEAKTVEANDIAELKFRLDKLERVINSR